MRIIIYVKINGGNDWYAKLNEDGTQTWVRVRNNLIHDGGINSVPKSFDANTGLCSSVKPSQK